MVALGLLSSGITYEIDYEVRKFHSQDSLIELRKLYKKIGLTLDKGRFREALEQIHLEGPCTVLPKTII